MSSNLAQTCANYQAPVSAGDLGNMAAQLLGKSAAYQQGCNLNSFYTAMAGKMSLGPLGLGGSASIAAQVSGLDKVGCQTVAAVLGNYFNACMQTKCFITNDTQSQLQDIESDQNVNVIIANGSQADNENCPNGTSINMSSSITGKVVTSIGTQAMLNIKNAVQQAQQATQQQLANLQNGFQSTDSGGAFLQAMQNQVVNSDITNNLNNTQNKIKNLFKSDQKVNYEVLNNSKAINVLPCNVDMNSIFDLQIASIVSSCYSSDFTNTVSQFLSSSQSQKVLEKNAGVPNVVGQFLSDNVGYIIGIIVVVLLGVLAMKFFKSKQGQQLLNKGLQKGLPSGKKSI